MKLSSILLWPFGGRPSISRELSDDLGRRLEAFAFAAETGILDEARSSVGDALDNLRGLRERILATIDHHKSRVAKHEGELAECERSIAAFELAAAELKDTDKPMLAVVRKAKAAAE
jgi:hypothetical protein